MTGSSTSSGLYTDAFRRGLKDLGWVEGRDVVLDIRYGNGDSKLFDGLAAELLALKPDLIFAPATLTTLAVRRLSADVPIIFAHAADPIGSGLIASWAHPGGNSTGLSPIGAELGAKRLQLLREYVPKLARVAVMNDPTPGYHPAILETVLRAGKKLGIEMSVVNASNEAEIDPAFRKIEREHSNGVYVLDGLLFLRHRKMVAARAAEIRVPAIYPDAQYAMEGGLMSYGADYVDQCRRAAAYADKILKGAKPGDLPVEQPTKFELVVNLKTAKALNLKTPQSVLLRADRVIE
jgi:putative ABC transport system substrate-binding protein